MMQQSPVSGGLGGASYIDPLGAISLSCTIGLEGNRLLICAQNRGVFFIELYTSYFAIAPVTE